jgi:hypothetical protein
MSKEIDHQEPLPFEDRRSIDAVRPGSKMTASFNTLDLNLLRVFDAVMEERSFLRASQKINLNQSAVSHAGAPERDARRRIVHSNHYGNAAHRTSLGHGRDSQGGPQIPRSRNRVAAVRTRDLQQEIHDRGE